MLQLNKLLLVDWSIRWPGFPRGKINDLWIFITFSVKRGIREIFRVKYDYDFGSQTLSWTLENYFNSVFYFHCEEILRVQIGKVSESLISDAKPKEFESCEDVSCWRQWAYIVHCIYGDDAWTKLKSMRQNVIRFLGTLSWTTVANNMSFPPRSFKKC